MLYVGRKVVCTNARGWPQFRRAPDMLPVEGETYTVFDVRQLPEWDEPGILLNEILNLAPDGGEWLLYFRGSRFAPLYPTDISVFTRMLEPSPATAVRFTTGLPTGFVPPVFVDFVVERQPENAQGLAELLRTAKKAPPAAPEHRQRPNWFRTILGFAKRRQRPQR